MSDQPSPQVDTDELLTAAEVAAKLKTNPRTILRMLADGEIPAAVDRPKMKRFEWSAVKAALAAQVRPPAKK